MNLGFNASIFKNIIRKKKYCLSVKRNLVSTNRQSVLNVWYFVLKEKQKKKKKKRTVIQRRKDPLINPFLSFLCWKYVENFRKTANQPSTSLAVAMQQKFAPPESRRSCVFRRSRKFSNVWTPRVRGMAGLKKQKARRTVADKSVTIPAIAPGTGYPIANKRYQARSWKVCYSLVAIRKDEFLVARDSGSCYERRAVVSFCISVSAL